MPTPAAQFQGLIRGWSKRQDSSGAPRPIFRTAVEPPAPPLARSCRLKRGGAKRAVTRSAAGGGTLYKADSTAGSIRYFRVSGTMGNNTAGRQRPSLAELAQLGVAPRLALGRGHRGRYRSRLRLQRAPQNLARRRGTVE